MTQTISRMQRAKATALSCKLHHNEALKDPFVITRAGVPMFSTMASTTTDAQGTRCEGVSINDSQASQVGLLALALSGFAIEMIQKGAPNVTQKSIAHALAGNRKTTLDTFQGILRDLIEMSPAFVQGLVEADSSAIGKKALLRHQNNLPFRGDLEAFEAGCDGHWMTREVLLKLGLVREFERTSLALETHTQALYGSLARFGRAYSAWERGFPLFYADLNLPSHRRAAAVVDEMAHGSVVLVTPSLASTTHPKLGAHWLVVEDSLGDFANTLGVRAPVCLLERRLGGWTLTYPVRPVSAAVLKRYPKEKLGRALAGCMPQAGFVALQKSPKQKVSGQNEVETPTESQDKELACVG